MCGHGAPRHPERSATACATATWSTTPSRQQTASAPTPVAAGSGFSLAVGSGTVWGWGKNSSGQLGTGGTTQRTVPAVATTTEGLMACPIGSVPEDDGSACSLASGTMYDYTVTTTLGRWTASSGVASLRAGLR